MAVSYLASLKNELMALNIDNQLDTMYIGGGTPTSLEDDLFITLLDMVKPYTNGVKEFTIEANPESLTLEKLEIMKKYNVNRISIGVESTDDKILSSINRHHTFEDVKTAILRSKSVGIDNLNVDLILGLPHVSLALLNKDLDNILSLDVKHISCYSLTVHPHTVFGINHIVPKEDDYMRQLYDLVEDKLTNEGYIHYEVSNFSKPGYHSLHNLTYWKDEQYYAIGLGASGYIDNVRYTNTKNFDKYIKGNWIEEKEVVSVNDDREYFIMLNLRTIFGLDLNEYKSRFNEDLLVLKNKEINLMVKLGNLKLESNKLIPTYQGMMVLDQIILKLI